MRGNEMPTIKDFQKIKARLDDGKPLWICINPGTIKHLPIGWLINLASCDCIKTASRDDEKNSQKVCELQSKLG